LFILNLDFESNVFSSPAAWGRFVCIP